MKNFSARISSWPATGSLISAPQELTATGSPSQQATELRTILLAMLADPAFREAVQVSSGSLLQAITDIEAGRPISQAKLRRATLSTLRYRLRTASRATPFGLFAGVTTGTFGPDCAARVGTNHRKGVRPDRGWLAALISELEADPAVVCGLTLVTNNLCYRRGDRWVRSFSRSAGSDGVGTGEQASVRATAVVQALIRLAAVPVRFDDLVTRASAEFPSAPAGAIAGMVRTLLAQDFLLSDLAPAKDEQRPLEALSQHPAIARTESLAGRLSAISQQLSDYQARPIGAGSDQWQAARRGLAELTGGHQASLMQVDLATDATLALPEEVAAEAERAVQALWLMSVPDTTPAHLGSYHRRFIDRYGRDLLVPLAELVDAETGLGYPPEYRTDSGTTSAGRYPASRETLVAELLQRALLRGDPEITLSAEDVRRLTVAGKAPAPPELDFTFHVLAGTAQAVQDGDFRLVRGPSAAPSSGALAGRFGYLFPERAGLAGASDLRPTSADGRLRVQLDFDPSEPRHVNVMQAPVAAPVVLALGSYAAEGKPDVLGPNDIAIGATGDRLYAASLIHQAEIEIVLPHMLSTRRSAPPMARLLQEISRSAWRIPHDWSWGTHARLPYLPRVRFGRTVLSPARWRPSRELVAAAAGQGCFEEVLQSWRQDWQVPATVHASHGDQQLRLELELAVHRQILQQQLARYPELLLVEACWTGGELGWLDGYLHEIVISLTAERPQPLGPVSTIVRTPSRQRLPGGEWLYAKVYAAEDLQEELLATRLPDLLEQLPGSVDRWFYLRYRDPEPHLRLRLHGDREQLWSELLPVLSSWTQQLLDLGLARRLVIDSYQPEVDRYGGPDAIESAEGLFHADSVAALAEIKRRSAGALAMRPELIVAAGFASLAHAFDPDGWQQLMLELRPPRALLAAVRPRLSEISSILQPESGWPALAGDPDGAQLLAGWQLRNPAVASFGARVRELDRTGRLNSPVATVLRSVLHVHHNRLIGIDPQAEALALALVHSAAEAHCRRARFVPAG